MKGFSCPFKDLEDGMVYCKKCSSVGKIAELRRDCPDRPPTVNPVVNTPGGGL